MSNAYGTTNYSGTYRNKDYQENLLYKKKLKRLKKWIKNLVFENSALCDQVADMQNSLAVSKEERLMLVKKLNLFQGEIEPPTLTTKTQIGNSNSPVPPIEISTPKKIVKKRTPTEVSVEAKQKPKKNSKTARKVVQLIPLDVHGRPIFPISLGDLTVFSLGDVVADKPAYHTEDLIFPIGYCSTRAYASLKDARVKSLYTCKILDGGFKPRFEIVSDSDLDQPLVGSTPDECHWRLLSAISPSLSSITPKGADFFGISHPTIQNLIQSSPGTRKLANYKQQKFAIKKSLSDRDTSPATEEENDPSLDFTALHRHYSLTSVYPAIKQEIPNDIIHFQGLLS
ncbi:transforming growth factor beta regulator 1 isoform X1 [Trichogramma pretiosum]|uniref:transforming growth factor beta regulator 1 isoform X1 n=1 Tax=Trichogramma pretiosum TaxID=7493 RepID=UPI0006C9B483|nr:transforming growth factor beta regulator 1 isoform X1 [Trichogramma pretiosum]